MDNFISFIVIPSYPRKMQNRFHDQNKRITEFQHEVWVECPRCLERAVARVDHGERKARLRCTACHYGKEKSTLTEIMGIKVNVINSADAYFGAELWFQHPFKNDTFWAYNPAHLEYLEDYISAQLREHKERSHFTLLEKLPKFYHEAKNREPLLKIIKKIKIDLLKNKSR
ncbi:hypothetical protein [Sphingobacterium sp.]|uniref:hypothetical protein n=1 Tax=Sphingobacterium sp. TaxID=341027 RepID=UPI00289C9A4B|nr:hypothetical protein [Sphingobacterium sp.]